MPELFIGIDYEGIPCLKITKDSADDPAFTPDSERAKFAYNSKDGSSAEINEIVGPHYEPLDPAEWGNSAVYSDGAGYDVTVYFSPPTSDENSYERAYLTAIDGGGFQQEGRTYFSERYFQNLQYNCPMLSDSHRRLSSGRYTNVVTNAGATFPGGGHVLTRQSPFNRVAEAGGQSVIVTDRTNGGTVLLETQPSSVGVVAPAERSKALGTSAARLRDAVAVTQANVAQLLGTTPYYYDQYQVVWNLPADETPLATVPPITGTSGVDAIKNTSTEFKIARPGYDVDDATYEELIFSAERRPAKVIAAGDVPIPANSTYEIECGFTLDDSIVVEQAIYDSASIAFPFPRNLYINHTWNFEYEIIGSKVVLYNDTGQAFRVRFMVIAADATPPSSGTNDIFREIEVDGEGVLQILRPGAADPPTLADIIIDSRWPSIPILKEGLIDVQAGQIAQGDTQTFTIDFDNPDNLFPFIKFSVIRRIGASSYFVTAPPVVRKLVGPVATGTEDARTGGDTTYAFLLSNTQARFYTYRGRPLEVGYSGAVLYDAYPVDKLRYYIFGIPT